MGDGGKVEEWKSGMVGNGVFERRGAEWQGGGVVPRADYCGRLWDSLNHEIHKTHESERRSRLSIQEFSATLR